jgi:hypothetical protein
MVHLSARSLTPATRRFAGMMASDKTEERMVKGVGLAARLARYKVAS